MPELGGKHLQDHQLGHDIPITPRGHDRHSVSVNDVKNDTNHGGGQNSDQSSNVEVSDEDDDEDSDFSGEADQGDDDDETDAEAPSHGRGKGKGKGMRPAIRIESADENESGNELNEVAMLGTGLRTGERAGNAYLTTKKRTFSEVSNNSVLFEDDADTHYPRRKNARTLSAGSFKPLLKYKENGGEVMIESEEAIESDDEDYSGVILVPEDDDTDMENFEHQEEHFIIQEEEHQVPRFSHQSSDARRFSLESHASDKIFDMTAPLDDDYLNGMNLPDLGFGQFFETQPTILPPAPVVKRKFSDSSTKRVRFDDEVQVSDSSSTSSSELDNSLYPDLFLEQDKLPPSLTQLLENDNDEDNGDFDSPESDTSFWDFGQDETQASRPNDADEFDESSDPGSSGYETDMGDTTDEYESDAEWDTNPQTPVQKKSVLHRPPSAMGSKASSPKPFERSNRHIGRAIPPTRGIFIHEDRSKAIAVTNRTTKTLTFFRPRASTVSWVAQAQNSSIDTANNSPRNSINQLNASDSDVSNDVLNNALATDIMLTGIFGAAPTNDFVFGTESIGPPEAFYPFVSIGTNGAIMDDVDDYDGDEDFEDDLDITDFMDFGDGDATDLEQEGDETDVPATPATSMMAIDGSTPAQPTPLAETPGNRNRNTSDAMLEHFDRGVVTSFRSNQDRYRDVACLPSDPTILASMSKPIRSGKSAETLMTPLRKRANSKRNGRSPYLPSSPLTGVSKASSRLHKSLMASSRAPRMGTFS